jgi:hypothetical protein
MSISTGSTMLLQPLPLPRHQPQRPQSHSLLFPKRPSQGPAPPQPPLPPSACPPPPSCPTKTFGSVGCPREVPSLLVLFRLRAAPSQGSQLMHVGEERRTHCSNHELCKTNRTGHEYLEGYCGEAIRVYPTCPQLQLPLLISPRG